MKVILADSHGAVFGKPQGTPNLGLLYLASYARRRLSDLDLKYLPQRVAIEEHLREIDAFQPDLYALSFTSYGMEAAYALVDQIKRRHPDLPVVVGGAHASAAPEATLKRSRADLCVVGEGEETLTQLLEALPRLQAALPGIPGIAYRDGDGIRRTPARAMVDDLDTIPFPARDLVREGDYVGLSHRRARPNTEMIVMRGCPFRCVFCANPVFRGQAQGPSALLELDVRHSRARGRAA